MRSARDIPGRAVVTGGAGFIGSNLVDALLDDGCEVTVLDNLSTGRVANLTAALGRGARLVRTDIRDAEAVSRAMAEARPEVVFHLAAQIDVRHSVDAPGFDAAVNVAGTATVLEAARRAGAERFVNTSSGGAIYGEPAALPASEASPIAPESPYGQAKHGAEGYCELYERLHGLSTVSLRYGNVYGPRQDPLGEAGVIAIFCGLALSGGAPTVFGDGLQTRDYVYVDDVVAANLAAAAAAVRGPVNIGGGVETSVLELVETLANVTGTSITPTHAPERLGEVRRIVLDCRRAEAELGWTPLVALDEGLERTLASTRQEALAREAI